LGAEDLPAAFVSKSACDWAVLATAYGKRFDSKESISEPAKRAFAQAVHLNPGFALTQSLLFVYYDSLSLVQAPPVTKQAITAVRLQYDWTGMGEQISYTVNIQQADTAPQVTASGLSITATRALNLEGNKSAVQALAPALTDLIPVRSQFSLMPCYDNYPDWKVALTWKDGTVLDLKTVRSNFVYLGGSWQTRIGQQNYVQVSFSFAKAMSDLIKALNLPQGKPAAMVCFPSPVFELAFP
jgi:hypothetical protein